MKYESSPLIVLLVLPDAGHSAPTPSNIVSTTLAFLSAPSVGTSSALTFTAIPLVAIVPAGNDALILALYRPASVSNGASCVLHDEPLINLSDASTSANRKP